ncbi:MAG TPA: 50S ribosomal protein L19 [Candidatus Methylomirabilis sp.]|nr:50S ribosomal protein L19 [Candidatus Methylomirabilis sp.]
MAETQSSKALTPDQIRTGMQVRVHHKIMEPTAKGELKERVQVFEGLVLNVGGAGIQRTMTVRKVSDGVGVEKIYPIHSPTIAKLELVKQFKVRRKHIGFMRHVKKRLKEVKTIA